MMEGIKGVSQKDLDLIYDFSRQAWALTEDELSQLEPGNISSILTTIKEQQQKLDYHIFSTRTREEIEHPEKHLLRIMRNPQFFPLTCKTLFCGDSDEPLKIMPYGNIILNELWTRQFPMLIASRGAGKSFNLALYIMLRMLFTQGSKIVIVASAFRQAKIVFEYMEKLWYNSPVYRDLVVGNKNMRGRENGPRRDIDRCEFVIGDSVCIALPLGDGTKIRGLRANYVIGEEFASIPEEIYSVVIQGFGAVASNPVANVENHFRVEFLKKVGFWNEQMEAIEESKKKGNQSVISGTPTYYFNHFYRYWKEYKKIINTGNDPVKVKELFNGDVPKNFDARDFCVIRLPWDVIPKGYMDEKTIGRAKQMSGTGSFNMEYGANFQTDSDGFFKRSLIRKCEVTHQNENLPEFASCNGKPNFTAQLTGFSDKKYYYGIDPASENDKFAIVIIEVWPDHRRIVYCWTSDKKEHNEKLKRKAVSEHDFFRYCNRKIRDLMKVFPPAKILIDAGGGGVTMRESFKDRDNLEENEQPIYECVVDNDPKFTDDLPGLHLIEMVYFQRHDWVSNANYGLKKDMEDQIILFPCFNAIDAAVAMEKDILTGRVVKNDKGDIIQLYDSLEDCMREIEDLKDELTTIVISKTDTGKEKWSTPQSSAPGMKKGYLRKDRYSALIMANAGARGDMYETRLQKEMFGGKTYESHGGFAGRQVGIGQADVEYYAPTWFKPIWKK